MSHALSVATWNIHKGFSQFNRRMMVHDLRDRLRGLAADIVFLQEVQGLHLGHAERHPDWPAQPQHEFLAAGVWHNHAYGRNMVYDHGHHGNAILSRYPILHEHNQDVTHLRFEKRGLLHCALDVPGLPLPLHCVCVHLSLFSRSRRWQMAALAARIEELVPEPSPLTARMQFCEPYVITTTSGMSFSSASPSPSSSLSEPTAGIIITWLLPPWYDHVSFFHSSTGVKEPTGSSAKHSSFWARSPGPMVRSWQLSRSVSTQVVSSPDVSTVLPVPLSPVPSFLSVPFTV